MYTSFFHWIQIHFLFSDLSTPTTYTRRAKNRVSREWSVDYRVCQTHMGCVCKILWRAVIMARITIICTITIICMIRSHQRLAYRRRSQVLCHPETIVWIICHMTQQTTIIIITVCRIHRHCMNHWKNWNVSDFREIFIQNIDSFYYLGLKRDFPMKL